MLCCVKWCSCFKSGNHFVQLIKPDLEILPDDFIINLCVI